MNPTMWLWMSIAVLVTGAAHASAAKTASRALPVVQVSDVKNSRGHLHLTLYRSAKGFPGKGAFETIRVPAKQGVTEIQIPVQDSSVAVAVYHDENDDQELNANFIGMPTEGYGFGNDARGRLGPPKFEEAVLLLSRGQSHVIRLAY